MFSNPVFVKELRVALRHGRSFVVLAVYVTALAAVIAAVYPRHRIVFAYPSSVPAISFSSHTENTAALVGRGIFNTFTRAQFILVLLLVPALTAPALTSEKEKQTLETLLVSGLTPYEIVLGKFYYSLFHVSLLIIASVPLTAVSFMLGGVSPMELATAYGLTFALAVGLTLVSLVVSAWVSRSHVATVMVYGSTVGFVIAYMLASELLIPSLVIAFFFLWITAYVLVFRSTRRAGHRLRTMLPLRWIQVSLTLCMLGPAIAGAGSCVGLIMLTTGSDPLKQNQFWWDVARRFAAGTCVAGMTCIIIAVPLAIASVLLSRPVTPHTLLRHRWEAWLENWGSKQARKEGSGRRGELRPTYGVRPFIADGANPVLARELRGSLFGRKEQFVRALYVVTIATELLLIAFGRFDELLSLLPTLFRWYCVGNVVIILAVGATLGALTFSMEREQRSLDLLLTTPLSPKQIVFGKLASACYFTGYLVVASLPVVGFAFIMFVIPWYTALFVMVGFIVWGAWAAAMGVWCSLLFSRARQAVGAALGVVVLLVGGSALATGLMGSIRSVISIGEVWMVGRDAITCWLFALFPPLYINEFLGSLSGTAWRFGDFNVHPQFLTNVIRSLLVFIVCLVPLVSLAPWMFKRSAKKSSRGS